MTSEPHAGGERTVAKVGEAQSRSVRLQRRLALAIVGVIGAGVLGWYYFHVLETTRAEPAAARNSVRAAAASEMKLPALGPRTAAANARRPGATDADPTERSARAAPGGDGTPPAPVAVPADAQPVMARTIPPRPRPSARSSSPVLWRPAGAEATTEPRAARGNPLDALVALEGRQPAAGGGVAAPTASALGDALVPTVTTPVEAAVVPTRRWLLPKGSFLDCTLETAIDSTLPGMTTCVLAVDVFGADGRVVLLERGTRLVGETRGDVRAGQARVSVLWSEARTPTGVVVGLASPGTDALGRAGVAGTVDNHFTARFGSAVLLSVIDGAISSLVAHQQGSAGVIYNAQGSRDVATDALRNTIGIPPTINVPPGARIQVLVARDVDFRSVYRLISHAGS